MTHSKAGLHTGLIRRASPAKRGIHVNLKACFASTGVALVGVALAGAQLVDPRPTDAAIGRTAATNTFARTASGNGVTVKVSRRADIWSTTDGSTWMRHLSGTECLLHDVAFGNGVFVAVGNEGALVTSSDGDVWTRRNSRTDARLRGIVFGNGLLWPWVTRVS